MDVSSRAVRALAVVVVMIFRPKICRTVERKEELETRVLMR